jgi:hypothetical protein
MQLSKSFSCEVVVHLGSSAVDSPSSPLQRFVLLEVTGDFSVEEIQSIYRYAFDWIGRYFVPDVDGERNRFLAVETVYIENGKSGRYPYDRRQSHT